MVCRGFDQFDSDCNGDGDGDDKDSGDEAWHSVHSSWKQRCRIACGQSQATRSQPVATRRVVSLQVGFFRHAT